MEERETWRLCGRGCCSAAIAKQVVFNLLNMLSVQSRSSEDAERSLKMKLGQR